MRETWAEKAGRDAARARRREVEDRLAAFGLARGPRGLLRVVRGDEGASETRAARLRAALESLGPVFAAFGLYLSTRVDLLSASDCLELAATGARAGAALPDAVRELLSRELGREPGELFSSFDGDAFETQPLFQLHRARLHDGQPATVKLVRPDAEEALRVDSDLIPLTRGALASLGCAARGAEDAAADFRRALLRQTDLTHEARSLAALACDAQDCGLLRVPVVYTSHSAPRVLTTERLPGLTLDELVARRGPRREGSDFDGGDFGGFGGDDNHDNVARRLCVVWLRQSLLGGVFPSEPSLTSVTVLPNRQVAFTCGPFASLPAEPKANLWEYMLAAASENPERACEYLLKELRGDERHSSDDELRKRFRQAVPFRDGAWTLSDGGDSFAEHLLAHWQLAGAHGYVPRAHLTSFYKGLFRVAVLARLLDPEHDALADALQDVRLIAGLERMREAAKPRGLGDRFGSYAAVMVDLPRRFDEALTLAAEGSPRLKLKVSGRDASAGRKNSTAAVVSLLLLLAAFVLLSNHFRGALGNTEGYSAVIFLALGGLLLRAAARD